MPTNGQAVKIAHYSRSKFNSLTNKDSATIYYVKELDGTIKQYIGSTHVVSDVSNKTDLKSNTDNRSVKTVPNDYNAKFDIKGLKSNATLGITGQGSYSALLGIRGWTDSSGGNSHEFALTGDGEIYHRHGATTAWNAWNILAKQSWVTANTRSNTWMPTAGEISDMGTIGKKVSEPSTFDFDSFDIPSGIYSFNNDHPNNPPTGRYGTIIQTQYRVGQGNRYGTQIAFHDEIDRMFTRSTGSKGNSPWTEIASQPWVTSNTRSNTWMPTAAQVGAVPTSRTVNGKALSSNISLSAGEVGAYTKTEVDNKIAAIPAPDLTPYAKLTGAEFTGDVSMFGYDNYIQYATIGAIAVEDGLSMGYNKIQLLAEPTVNTDAANKKYVDDKFIKQLGTTYIKGGSGTEIYKQDGSINIFSERMRLGTRAIQTTDNKGKHTYLDLLNDNIRFEMGNKRPFQITPNQTRIKHYGLNNKVGELYVSNNVSLTGENGQGIYTTDSQTKIVGRNNGNTGEVLVVGDDEIRMTLDIGTDKTTFQMWQDGIELKTTEGIALYKTDSAGYSLAMINLEKAMNKILIEAQDGVTLRTNGSGYKAQLTPPLKSNDGKSVFNVWDNTKEMLSVKKETNGSTGLYVDGQKITAGGIGGGGTQLGAVRVNVDLDDMALGSVEDGWKYGIEVSYDGLPTEDVQIWLFRYINKSSKNGSGKRRKNAMRHFFYDSSSEIHNSLTSALGIQWNGATLNYNTDMIIPTIIPTTQMTLKNGMLRATLIAAEHVEAIIESAGIITANDMYLNWKNESLTYRTAILGVAAVKKNPDNPYYPIVGPMTKFSIGFKPLRYGDNYNTRTKFKMM